MSAYIVSDETIAGMLQVFKYAIPHNEISIYWRGVSYRANIYYSDTLSQKLIDENYRSVNYRYDEDEEPHRYTDPSDPKINNLTPVEIIKLCDCYGYQSCETDDWESTEAFAIYTVLREAAIKALPGYEDAPWGL